MEPRREPRHSTPLQSPAQSQVVEHILQKRNIMPTSHNQTVDKKRLVLMNAIIDGTKFNVGQIIADELSEACRTNHAILSCPCLISALCRAAQVPTRSKDKYIRSKMCWTRKEYMKKLDITEAIPIQVAMPTPTASEQAEPTVPADTQPSPAATPQATSKQQDSRATTLDSPLGIATPSSPPSPLQPTK
ncbi:hypothetical protein GQ457_07G006700 [Hibiscus cannabinus]